MSNDYTAISAIVVITMAAFKFGEVLINRFTGNGPSGIRKQISEIQDNHLHELKDILIKLDNRSEQILIKLNILIDRAKR